LASGEFKKESQSAKFYTENASDESWRLIANFLVNPHQMRQDLAYFANRLRL
jgi:hypothetical protein